MITTRVILCLGFSQLVLWGISFYLIGVFGDLIVAELGWSRTLVYGGFSVALLVMATVSPLVGSLIDRHGGGPVITSGSVLCAIGCASLSVSQSIPVYYAAWICLGVAMRCTLYDAAFAALARIGGKSARRPISLITLLGGLAATCFWPIGHFLAELLGWRGAVMTYAGIALLMAPLQLIMPTERHIETQPPEDENSSRQPIAEPTNRLLPTIFYAAIIALGNGLHAGMSAHLISVLSGIGLGLTLAVSIASLRGIGQSAARLIEVLFGRQLHPINLNLIAAVAMPVSFLIALVGGGYVITAIVFTVVYGGATGILTITRGTLPLVLFDHRTYGAHIGKLLVPSFIASALSPLAYAYVIEEHGAYAALYVSVAIGVVILVASAALRLLAYRKR